MKSSSKYRQKTWQKKPLEAVKKCAIQYKITREKVLRTDRYFFQYVDSLQHLSRYIRFYGEVYRVDVLLKNTKKNLQRLEAKIPEVRKIFVL